MIINRGEEGIWIKITHSYDWWQETLFKNVPGLVPLNQMRHFEEAPPITDPKGVYIEILWM
jgi:hypothetical protein